MSTTPYQRYLAIDRMTKRIESVGARVAIATLTTYDSHDIGFQVSTNYGQAKDNEATVNALMDAYPDFTLRRSSGLLYLDHVDHNGLKTELYFGSGVCERVQVGTRHVPAREAYDEPVFETRCPDPLNSL